MHFLLYHITAVDALALYKSRDASEKLFREDTRKTFEEK